MPHLDKQNTGKQTDRTPDATPAPVANFLIDPVTGEAKHPQLAQPPSIVTGMNDDEADTLHAQQIADLQQALALLAAGGELDKLEDVNSTLAQATAGRYEIVSLGDGTYQLVAVEDLSDTVTELAEQLAELMQTVVDNGNSAATMQSVDALQTQLNELAQTVSANSNDDDSAALAAIAALQDGLTALTVIVERQAGTIFNSSINNLIADRFSGFVSKFAGSFIASVDTFNFELTADIDNGNMGIIITTTDDGTDAQNLARLSRLEDDAVLATPTGEAYTEAQSRLGPFTGEVTGAIVGAEYFVYVYSDIRTARIENVVLKLFAGDTGAGEEANAELAEQVEQLSQQVAALQSGVSQLTDATLGTLTDLTTGTAENTVGAFAISSNGDGTYTLEEIPNTVTTIFDRCTPNGVQLAHLTSTGTFYLGSFVAPKETAQLTMTGEVATGTGSVHVSKGFISGGFGATSVVTDLRNIADGIVYDPSAERLTPSVPEHVTDLSNLEPGEAYHVIAFAGGGSRVDEICFKVTVETTAFEPVPATDNGSGVSGGIDLRLLPVYNSVLQAEVDLTDYNQYLIAGDNVVYFVPAGKGLGIDGGTGGINGENPPDPTIPTNPANGGEINEGFFQDAFNTLNINGQVNNNFIIDSLEVLLENKAYAELPTLTATVAGQNVSSSLTAFSKDNGDGTHTHLLRLDTRLNPFNSFQIQGNSTTGNLGGDDTAPTFYVS